MNTALVWRKILHELSNPARKLIPLEEGREELRDRGSISRGPRDLAGPKPWPPEPHMVVAARRLWLSEHPRAEVARQLREVGAKHGVLDVDYSVHHAPDLGEPRRIPEGWTYRQIIEMIERESD